MSFRTASRSFLAALALAVAAVPAFAGGVRNVNRPALSSFGNLQAAVDAALDGETLLVAQGTYAGFTVDNKSLAIIAAPNAVVSIQGTIDVRNLGPARWVAVVGLNTVGAIDTSGQYFWQAWTSHPALQLTDNLGHVHCERCVFQGGAGALSLAGTSPHHGNGGQGVVLVDSRRVAFVGCTLKGGKGAGNSTGDYETYGGNGGRAVDAQGSTVALYDCVVRGGDGGVGGTQGGSGGDGYHELDFGVVASGTTFEGGDGALTWDFLPGGPSDGGSGLFVDQGAQAQVLDCSYIAGTAGSCPCCDTAGNPGLTIGGAGVINQHAGSARSLSAVSVVSDSSIWNVTVTGEPGDHVSIAYSATPAYVVPNPVTGVQLVPSNAVALHTPNVVLPASGVAVLPVRTGAPLGGKNGKFWFLQGTFTDTSGVQWLASPLHRLVLARHAAPDCNGNGVADLLDVIQASAPDADHDLVPDACDLDCNGNGIIDGLDVANGAPDIDHDLVPDACELARTWYVDGSAAPGGDGTAGAPMRAIRTAIAASLSGDTVVVANGVYRGFNNCELDFAGKNIVVRSANGAANCTIDGEGTSRAFNLHSNESLASRIDGFTIVNGHAPGAAPYMISRGGGIYASGATPTITHCVITNCTADHYGGGLWIQGGRVEGCTVSFNTSRHPSDGSSGAGGGLYCAGPASIVGCRFEGNQARAAGAVMTGGQFGAFNIAISRCTFVSNSADYAGGGLYDNCATGSVVTVDECLFAGNAADTGGAIMGAQYGGGNPGTLSISGATLAGNTSIHQGSALFVSYRTSATLANSILWSNPAAQGFQVRLDQTTATLTLDWNDIQNGAASINPGAATLDFGANNIALDPQFADSVYHLGALSPCIDAGDDSSIALDSADCDGDGVTSEQAPLDLDGLARRVDDPAVADTGIGGAPVVDLGAYERP